jgi:hypothetical protein
VRSGWSASISVPPSWRARVALIWGRGGMAAWLGRFRACPGADRHWNAFPGGFYVKSATCVSLVVHVPNASRRVRFGIGRRC